MADADEQQQHQQQQHASEGGGDAPTDQATMAAAPASSTAAASTDQEAKEEEEEKAAAPPTRAEETEPQANSVAEEPRVTVNLKFIHRERLSVQCLPTILISELKRKVLEVYSRHVEIEDSAPGTGEAETATGSLRLIYKGKVMKDDQTLATYNFVHDDTIHAVFGRPQPAESASATNGEATSASSSAAPATTSGPTATSSTTVPSNSTGGAPPTTAGMRDFGNGLMMGRFSFDSDENSPLPDLGNLINSMLSSFAGGSVSEGASTSARFTSSDSPPTGAPPSSGTGTSTVATSATVSSTTTSAPPSSSTSASSASNATTTSSASTPAVSSSVARVSTPASSLSATSAPLPYTAVRISTPIPAQAPPSNLAGNATSLLNQAASLRRMIPALELSPLSQPAGLSTEMYSLGNALREAGDTFLAVHRQLQFVATRFLSENNLNTSERLRLRTRVHQLVSILDQVGSLSRSVSSNLAASSYGPGAVQVPPQSSQTASHLPSTTPTVVQPPTTSVSVSPTVNIFSGGGGQGGGGANASNLGNLIVDLLQVVNSLGSGRPPAATPNSTAAPGAPSTATTAAASSPSSTAPNVPGSLGSLLNLVSALTSGVRPGPSPMPSSGSSSQGPTTAANQSQATTNAVSQTPGNVQTPVSSSPDATITPNIPSQPLSTLFSQVMRDMNTLDEWDPEAAEDLLKRIYPHLRHRVRSLFGSADNTSQQLLRKKWCENAVEEIESAMRGVLESHSQVYTRDRLRCRINEVTLEHLLEILLDSNAGDLHDQAHINASLDKLRKLLRKFCTTVHADTAEQTSSIEAVRIAANVLSSVLTTEDLSVRRSAEGLANRVNREATSFLKTRTAVR